MGLLDRYRSPAPETRGLVASANDYSGHGGLVGAAVLVGDPQAKDASKPAKRERWQEEAWGYYDAVGELHYATGFIADCLSRVVLQPGWLGDDDKVGFVFDDEGKPMEGIDADLADMATALIRQLKAPVGGQSALLAALGRQLTVPADCYVLGHDTMAGGEVVDRSWEVLSTDELKPADERYVDGVKVQSWKRHRAPSGQGEDVPPGDRVIRVYRQHPRFSAMADSSIRPLLDVLEELVLLTRQVRATATSRLAGAGVYWIPKEVEFERTPDTPEGVEPFTHQMLTAMTTPIRDRGSAASVVPLIARAPGDKIVQIRYDRFDPPDDSLSVLKRAEAVERLANGLPLPKEVVTGQGKANHWGAWQIDESTFKAHIEPLLEIVVDAFTLAYLLPSLRAYKGLPPDSPLPESIARFKVWWDATELVVHPNREESANTGYGTASAPNFLLKGKTWRRDHGYSEADKPDDDEIAERIAWAQAIKVRETIDAETPGAVDVGETGPGGSTPGQGEGSPSTDPTGADGSEPSGAAAVAADAGMRRLAMQLAIVADFAVERAVDRAGSRLRSKLNGRATVAQKEELRRTANADVPRLLGPEGVARLIPADDMFTGEFETLARMVRRWAAEAGMGDHADELVDRTVELVAETSTRRLFKPAERVEVAEVVGIVAGAR